MWCRLVLSRFFSLFLWSRTCSPASFIRFSFHPMHFTVLLLYSTHTTRIRNICTYFYGFWSSYIENLWVFTRIFRVCVCVTTAFAFLACVINPIRKHRISIPFNSIQFQPNPFSFGHKNKRTVDVCERSEMCGFCCCCRCYCVRKSRGSSRQNIIINANALSRHNCKFCLSVFIMMVWLSQTIASNLFITLKRYT